MYTIMKIKSVFWILYILLLAHPFLAQTISFPEEKGITLGDITPMVVHNEVKGYYTCTFEKYATDWGGEADYNLIVMDINFKITKDMTLTLPKSIKKIAFNGSHFCMMMIEGKFVRYNIYDMDGLLVGNRSVEYDDTAKPDREVLRPIVAVPYKGFIRTGVFKRMNSYFEMFDLTGKALWKIDPKEFEGGASSDNVEYLQIIEASEHLLIVGVNLASLREREAKSRNREFQRVYNIQTGHESCELNVTGKSIRILYGAISGPDEIALYGVYFPGGVKGPIGEIWGGEEYGFYIQVFDSTGKLKYEYINDGQNELEELIGNIAEAQYDASFNLWLHTMIKSKDKYYMVCELYAHKPRGIRNMVVLKFDLIQSEPDVHVYQKRIPDQPMIVEVKNVENYNLGNNFSVLGYFDYKFTTQNIDHSMFSAIYTSAEGDDQKNQNHYVAAIALDREENLVNPKIQLVSNPDDIYVLPGKPGYIAVAEFFKKEKKLSLTLHKFDF